MSVSYTHLDVYKRQDPEDIRRVVLERCADFMPQRDKEKWRAALEAIPTVSADRREAGARVMLSLSLIHI